mmetsp:Transcript_46656/g.109782  ORF Transcript_46656/g.109782 Transcript_46656/m.109782 type:complete len:207 (-) Transcript_46656:490-1110(-)
MMGIGGMVERRGTRWSRSRAWDCTRAGGTRGRSGRALEKWCMRTEARTRAGGWPTAGKATATSGLQPPTKPTTASSTTVWRTAMALGTMRPARCTLATGSMAISTAGGSYGSQIQREGMLLQQGRRTRQPPSRSKPTSTPTMIPRALPARVLQNRAREAPRLGSCSTMDPHSSSTWEWNWMQVRRRAACLNVKRRWRSPSLSLPKA